MIFSNCLLHGGPKGLSGCPVDQPSESSCEGVRKGDCSYYGNALELTETIKTWKDCSKFCNGMEACQAWTFRTEPTTECKLLANDSRECRLSYTPSMIPGGVEACPTPSTRPNSKGYWGGKHDQRGHEEL